MVEYEELKNKLSELETGDFEMDREEIKQRIEEIDETMKEKLKQYDGQEDDGIRRGIQSDGNRKKNEIRERCGHDWDVEFFEGYTGDARKRVQRIATCKVCGVTRSEEVSEESDRGWI